MKRFVLVLVAVMVLGGCQQSDLALKEKCQKYITDSRERIEKNNDKIGYAGAAQYFIGTFYSKLKQTCITVFYKASSFGDKYIYTVDGEDELTGRSMFSSEVSIPTTDEIDKVISRYDIIK